jgi:cytochrome c-type biogenesis protein CcmH
VRERIATGESDKQVLDFLVARYGEFVLLKPRLNLHTLLLWLLTPLVLIGGGFALWWHNRRRGSAGGSNDDAVMKLTAEEEARIEKLIAAQNETTST